MIWDRMQTPVSGVRVKHFVLIVCPSILPPADVLLRYKNIGLLWVWTYITWIYLNKQRLSCVSTGESHSHTKGRFMLEQN